MAETAGMSQARWQRIQELFEEARALNAGELNGWLRERCGDDLALQDEVLSLLAGATDGSVAFDARIDRAIAGAWAGVDDVQPGRLIGRYRVVRTLGRGGMGAVYLAERADEQFQQQVAVKLIGGMVAGGALARRFRAERQILANLNHPNIARLLDGGAGDDGVPYLAMEYIDGIRLDRYCDERGLDIRQRLRLFQQVCAAVQYAHQHLVVHRDIKPSNILVTAEGSPKLLDFGIAKLLDAERTGELDDLTRLQERLWTPGYASPEQMRGERIGTVSDVYSLGVLLYYLLTGMQPYARSGRNAEEFLRLVETLDPPRPSAAIDKSSPASRALGRSLAGDLDNIVLRAMHREPERRYPSAAALAEDVQRYLEDRPVEARPDAWTYRIGKFARRNAAALAATSVVVVSIAALVIFYTARLTAERDVAERERAVSAAVSQFMRDVFRVATPSAARGNSVTVREVLDAAVKRIDTDLGTEPRLRMQLLVSMGQAYNGLGLWDQARQLLERAVEQERKSFGNSHMELSAALTALATANHNLNRFDPALEQYRESLKIREGLGRVGDVDTATLLNSIAGTLRAQQHFDQALDYHGRAETIARALDRQQPRVLGQVLQGYAMTYLLMGEHSRAERLARASLALVHDAVNDGYEVYANSIYALAESLRRQYKLQESGRLQRELLNVQIDRLGADAPLVARTWNNLSHVMRASGKYDLVVAGGYVDLPSLDLGSATIDLCVVDCGGVSVDLPTIDGPRIDLPGEWRFAGANPFKDIRINAGNGIAAAGSGHVSMSAAHVTLGAELSLDLPDLTTSFSFDVLDFDVSTPEFGVEIPPISASITVVDADIGPGYNADFDGALCLAVQTSDCGRLEHSASSQSSFVDVRQTSASASASRSESSSSFGEEVVTAAATLDSAEAELIAMSAGRAQIEQGSIVELGAQAQRGMQVVNAVNASGAIVGNALNVGTQRGAATTSAGVSQTNSFTQYKTRPRDQ